MAEGIKITTRADATSAQQALTRARRAMDAALMRTAIAERTNLATLVSAGRGVTHNPACVPRPGATIQWSEQARAAITVKHITGLEPEDVAPTPHPDGTLTVAQLQQYEAELRASTAY